MNISILYLLSSVFFLFIVIVYIKKGFLELRYSIIWIFLCFVFIVISIYPNSIVFIQRIFHIEVYVNMLFLTFLAVMFLILFTLSIIISRISFKQRSLIQFIAIANTNSTVKTSNVLIIIPAFNESKSILSVVKDIKDNTTYDYIIINDCSKDNTYGICIENDIPVINLPVNLGIGGAIQTGYKYAHLKGYDIAVQFDGDGQHNASFLPELVKQIHNGYDMAIGSRFLLTDMEDGAFRSTAIRRIGIKYFKVLVRTLTCTIINDPTSGMRAANRSILLKFANSYPSDYPEPESLVTLLVKKYKVVEVAVRMNARTEGKSSISALKSIYYMLKVSLAIIIARINIHD